MKKIGCLLLLGTLPVSFLCGVYYSDWALRQSDIVVNLERVERLKDKEHEYSRVRSEEGHKIYVIWHR